MVFSILGLAIALAGAGVGAAMPFERAFKTLRGWGGGNSEVWREINKSFRRRSLISAILLVVGTFLQVWGSLHP